MSTPPFYLRPNKFVDRMLFVDLLQRVIGDEGAQDYCYISMGATFLPDHHVIYRRIGVGRLVSFGNDSEDIQRQKFNRPTSKMDCIELDSKDLPRDLPALRKGKKVAVWLDYMSPDQRRVQLDEAVEVLKLLTPGDLLRVTLNCDYRNFGEFNAAARKKYASLEKMAAAKLKDQIGDFLPAKLDAVTRKDFPPVLARAFKLVAEKAVTHRPDIAIEPILSTTYADGQRMLTVACLVRATTEQHLPAALRRWKYRSKDWDDLRYIDVPDLSLREKFHIDQRLKYSPSKIRGTMQFMPIDVVTGYKNFHRYYPGFQHVDA